MTERRTHPLLHILLMAGLCVMPGTPLLAQQAPDDWPCIQGYVPEVVLAVYWPQAVPESAASDWKRDKTIRALAERLGALDEYDDDARTAVTDFVASLADDQRVDALGLLATGTVATANVRRSDYLRGIRRYTRQQSSIAGQIEDGLNALARMDVEAVPADDPERVALEDTLRWHERVFDQREQAIVALCEQPVYVEQVLSDVLRDLTQYLP